MHLTKSNMHFNTLNKQVFEGNFFNLIKRASTKDPTLNIIVNSEVLSVILPRLRKRQGCPFSSFLFKKVSEIRQDKKIKCIHIGEKGLKLSLNAYNSTVCIEHTKVSTESSRTNK